MGSLETRPGLPSGSTVQLPDLLAQTTALLDDLMDAADIAKSFFIFLFSVIRHVRISFFDIFRLVAAIFVISHPAPSLARRSCF